MHRPFSPDCSCFSCEGVRVIGLVRAFETKKRTREMRPVEVERLAYECAIATAEDREAEGAVAEWADALTPRDQQETQR